MINHQQDNTKQIEEIMIEEIMNQQQGNTKERKKE